MYADSDLECSRCANCSSDDVWMGEFLVANLVEIFVPSTQDGWRVSEDGPFGVLDAFDLTNLFLKV